MAIKSSKIMYSGKKSVQNVVFIRALATQHIQGFLAFVNGSFITVDNKKYVVTLIISSRNLVVFFHRTTCRNANV
jgi:hypothetical protein